MTPELLPASLSGYRIHLVGIKGTGMTALAEILAARGARLSGSDVPETFYTDRILQELKIPYFESFSPTHLGEGVQLVIYSPAYSPQENVELKRAREAGLPLLTYPEALGSLSSRCDASAVSGTHGKTTTTAMAGAIFKSLGLPVTVLAGSEVAAFGNRCTCILGDRYLVAETCEYRRHFLKFRPARIVITNVEAEHLDYFQDLEDVLEAFVQFGLILPPGGALIYNRDDPGASQVARRLEQRRDDVALIPFGRSAPGEFHLLSVQTERGLTRFRLQGFQEELGLRIPGEHSAYNATAAAALCLQVLRQERGGVDAGDRERVTAALGEFRGSRRRSEVLGEARGVLFMDDYGHHPTEILKTLEGLRRFYPERRLVLDFMPHTYSRTRALLDRFATCFAPADEVILNRIYASAREKNTGEIDGQALFKAVSGRHPRVRYLEDQASALSYLERSLRPGDLLLTMGAGDNWKVGKSLFLKWSGLEA